MAQLTGDGASRLKKAESENSVEVQIGRVIRGNPYVPREAVDVGLPDSVPLSKTYEVEVTVKGIGIIIHLSIINSDENTGKATVTPSAIAETQTVTVRGTAMTKPKHGGQLKIQAKVGDVIKATSEGFSVCCHPLNWRCTFLEDVNGVGDLEGYNTDMVGFKVKDWFDSDSGVLDDLENVAISELVAEIRSDSPPFHNMDTAKVGVSGYLNRDEDEGIDAHVLLYRPDGGTAGICIQEQLSIYTCKCCEAQDIVLPNSGFRIVHQALKRGGLWVHRVKKKGTAVKIGEYETEAGEADLTSKDHFLPLY